MSVAINGTLEGKYRAAHLIIEQVEIFKYGGPVNTFPFLILLLTQSFVTLIDYLKWKSLESKFSSIDIKLGPVQRQQTRRARRA